jgi:pyruvate dehydrogenase (quinone)
MESLRTHQEKIRFLQVRHEETAAFMACGYAKYTGKLGVCLATSGPGAIHLLNGLYDARLDGQPVLAITGMQYHDLIGTFTQQDVETDKLFMDVCVYNERIMGATHVQNVMDLACRTALAYRGVSHVTIPVDFQEEKVHNWERSKRNLANFTNAVRTRSYEVPADSELHRAADILNRGKKVAILAGRGALGAGDLVEQVAELLAAPVAKPLLGKSVLPDDSPYTTGPVGLLGTAPSQEILEDCDTLLMVGTSFPYLEFMPKPGQAKGVQIDINPQRIALRYPVEVGLVGDSKTVLSRLIPLLQRKEDRGFLKMAQAGMKDWWERMEKQATRMDKPMKPQVAAWELGKRLRNDAIVSCDSGTIATWWARHIPARKGQMHSLSGTLATMAPGLPYTLAAQVAYPDRQCIAFVGDGGFSMLMADFVTAVKYKLPIKVVIIKNDTLGQIKWEQMVFLGNPEYGVGLQPIDFAEFAHACGGVGFTVDDPKACGETIEQFLNAPGPAILQAVVDPLEPPMPGKIKAEQALHFAESLARGEPNRGKIALTVASDKVKEMV